MTADHHHVVLFVDDCENLRDAFGRLLSARGYAVRAAASGVEALSLLTAGFRPCVVLLDQNMPGMRGLEVEAVMRSRPELCAIPTVFMSGAAPSGELAGHAVLAKPFDAADLFATVDAHARCAPPAPRRACDPEPRVERHIESTLDELRTQIELAHDLQRARSQIVDRLQLALQAFEKASRHG